MSGFKRGSIASPGAAVSLLCVQMARQNTSFETLSPCCIDPVALKVMNCSDHICVPLKEFSGNSGETSDSVMSSFFRLKSQPLRTHFLVTTKSVLQLLKQHKY